jgi:hypothetical protein
MDLNNKNSNVSDGSTLKTTYLTIETQAALKQSTHNATIANAFYPMFAHPQARLETFRKWPTTLSQQPADLVKAGFFYYGINDMVKCFNCNAKLNNWDHNDDPYETHVRWSPTCLYMKQLMGVEYIEKMRNKFKNIESGFTPYISCVEPSVMDKIMQIKYDRQNPLAPTQLESHTGKNVTEQNKDPNHQQHPSDLLKDYERLKTERMCVICLNKDKHVVFLPCAHLVSCFECSLSLVNCPICRADVQSKIRVFG